MRMGVLNGTIPSAISDTSATLSAFLKEDPSIPTGCVSSAVFHLPNSAIALATTVNKLLHNVRAPTRDINIVPSLVENSLLSTSKFADAGYTAIYDENEVNFNDAKTTNAVLKGWCCHLTHLWCFPLFPIITNLNTDTLVLDHPSSQDSLNSMYTVKTNQISRKETYFIFNFENIIFPVFVVRSQAPITIRITMMNAFNDETSELDEKSTRPATASALTGPVQVKIDYIAESSDAVPTVTIKKQKPTTPTIFTPLR